MNRDLPSRLHRFWIYLSDRVKHGQSWWITDDLKRPVRCFSPSTLSRGDDLTGGTMSLAEYKEIRRSLRRSQSALALGLCIGWCMLGYSAFLLINLVLEIMQRGIPADFVKTAIWCVGIGLLSVFTLRGLGSDPEAVAKELKARGRCASCAFDLRESIPVEGELIRCPECEARWRIARPQTSA